MDFQEIIEKKYTGKLEASFLPRLKFRKVIFFFFLILHKYFYIFIFFLRSSEKEKEED